MALLLPLRLGDGGAVWFAASAGHSMQPLPSACGGTRSHRYPGGQKSPCGGEPPPAPPAAPRQQAPGSTAAAQAYWYWLVSASWAELSEVEEEALPPQTYHAQAWLQTAP